MNIWQISCILFSKIGTIMISKYSMLYTVVLVYAIVWNGESDTVMLSICNSSDVAINSEISQFYA